MSSLSRRSLVAGIVATAAMAATPARAGQTVRVGYQKYGNLLLLKATGLLEQKLAPLGWSVDWKQFVSGPPLMEALGAGAIDFGSAGEAPPIFAQAAGAPLVYLGAEAPSPAGEAILVKNKSPLTSLSDLRGRKVAFNRGSNVHYLVVRALEKGGLSIRDITPVYLSPADGRAAFERGSVDAWAIWDPFLAAAQASTDTRVLADGTGVVANREFYLGTRRFNERPIYTAIQQAIVEMERRTKNDLDQAARILSPGIGLPVPVVTVAVKRKTWTLQAMNSEIVRQQQIVADTFATLNLIPRSIKIADALPEA